MVIYQKSTYYSKVGQFWFLKNHGASFVYVTNQISQIDLHNK